MDFEQEVAISASAYGWSVRLINILKKMLGVNIKLHHDEGQVAEGEIFLFNHFARFETFIPQYLIYNESGAYCRSVASAEFFGGDDAFANYLLSVGAVPNNHPHLIPYLAAEALRGRKIIIFPEGGMVKDRRVVDARGQYSIYSRTALERRKHHTGAAVLSLTLDVLKKAIQHAHGEGDHSRLELWAKALHMDTVDDLLQAAYRPTTIVPANITFYPMRVGDNILRRGVELFNRGISRRLSEELLIEGNILFKHTDMDIRLGDVIHVDQYWRWWEQKLIMQVGRITASMGSLLELSAQSEQWEERLLAKRLARCALKLRDQYMHEMYTEVTVNLSHLASKLIYELLDECKAKVEQDAFRRMLYLAVKYAQQESAIHLHRSLKMPEGYAGLLDGECKGLDQFFHTAASLGLVEQEDLHYQFLPKLCGQHEFDDIRMENLVAVYANEVAPLASIVDIVKRAIADAPTVDDRTLAQMRFDDELQAFQWDKRYYSKSRFQELNSKETATESGEPFLLLPEQPKELGIVLTHGFLASPAEVRAFGEKLAALGYPVIGTRLKGHGTSPWDLRDRSWKDWLQSVRHAFQIMEGFVERICLVGFSTGGALSLRFAADQPDCLVGVAAVSVPIKFRSRNMAFVPMVHRANRFVSWVSTYEGVMPFRSNESEHPTINYRSMPLRGLFELGLMVDEVEERLQDVRAPVLLFQGTDDHVVNARSVKIIYNKIGSQQKDVVMIPTERHGILNEDIGGVQAQIIGFLERLVSSVQDG